MKFIMTNTRRYSKVLLNELADYSAGKTMLCIENSGRFPERTCTGDFGRGIG